MSLCVLLMILQRVVVLLCCGLSFGIAMPAYNRTWGYVRMYEHNPMYDYLLFVVVSVLTQGYEYSRHLTSHLTLYVQYVLAYCWLN